MKSSICDEVSKTGVFDFISKLKNSRDGKRYAAMLGGYMPVYSQYGTDIYASDVVQQAISCIVMEMKKLTPRHIRADGGDMLPVSSSIDRLLRKPNEWMSISDLIEKTFWQLFLNYNAFLIPTFDRKYRADGSSYKEYTGLYPVQPVQVDFIQDASDELFITLRFPSGYECTLRYADVIHLRYRYSINEYMGGNEFGQPDNRALLKTLELNETMLTGVGKALKSSFSVNGIIKYNTLLDDGAMDKAIKQLEVHLANNESGFLPMDMKGEFIPLQNKIQLVDPNTLKFIDEKILRTFRVPVAILSGDYTKQTYEAWYQGCLEPLIISISQAFTDTLFTDRERSFGNQIKFLPHELIFMTTEQKISLFDILTDTAACYKNELRTAFGMYPLEELAGQLAISSNKSNAINNEADGDNADGDYGGGDQNGSLSE